MAYGNYGIPTVGQIAQNLGAFNMPPAQAMPSPAAAEIFRRSLRFMVVCLRL